MIFPIERLPRFLLPVAEILPLTHPVRLTRALSMGTLSLVSLWDFVYMLFITFGVGAFAVHRLKKKLID